MTEMFQSLRKLIPLKKYKGSGKLIWTPEAIAAFEFAKWQSLIARSYTSWKIRRLLSYIRMPPIMASANTYSR
jgi:hypothetical protein